MCAANRIRLLPKSPRSHFIAVGQRPRRVSTSAGTRFILTTTVMMPASESVDPLNHEFGFSPQGFDTFKNLVHGLQGICSLGT